MCPAGKETQVKGRSGKERAGKGRSNRPSHSGKRGRKPAAGINAENAEKTGHSAASSSSVNPADTSTTHAKPGTAHKPGAAGLAARQRASALLHAVLVRGRPLDEMLEEIAGSGPELAPRDRAFAHAITATALRRKGQIDAVIARFITRELPEDRGPLDQILLAAAAQILFLGTPPHAAINLAVEQARRNRKAGRFARLVNAVLRRVTEHGPALIAAQDAERLNTPDWLWQRWCTAYGEAQARAVAAAHLREAPLDLTVKDDPQGWAERLGGVALAETGGGLGGYSVRLAQKGRVEDLPGYQDGAWWVQDAAAALPARLLLSALAARPVAGAAIADLCAAPGGKTAQLALAGAAVSALDISAARLKRLGDNLARLHLQARLSVGDATSWPGAPESETQGAEKAGGRFDAILLDAPCSATGTIRRHPDIPHLKRPGDIAPLAALQSRLLDHALDLLRPGGYLVYCTCSLEEEEGPKQITALLERASSVRLDPIRPQELGGQSEWIAGRGWLRTLPSYSPAPQTGAPGAEAPPCLPPDLAGMDGFFAARLIKQG